ncbi:MAG: hypothetical protein JRH11_08145 [Deltaproteobacteria bacterium]|nr:hypothetical protein [Deltaproteobacteria bacterium]
MLPTNRRGLWGAATVVVAAIGVVGAGVLLMPSPRVEGEGVGVGVAGAEAGAVSVSEAEGVSVSVSEAEGVSEGVGEGVGEGVSVSVSEAEAEAEAVSVSVSEGVGVGVGEGEGEARAEVARAAETGRRAGMVRGAGSDARTTMRRGVETALPVEVDVQGAAGMADMGEEAPVPVTAYLRIPRTTAAQESIEVDGRPHGFTPRMLGLPTGPHQVVIRDAASREVILDRSINLAAHHTRVAPLSLPH